MIQNSTPDGPSGPPSARLVYVVDDELLLLELADSILSGEGYHLEKFLSSDLALKAFREATIKPSLMITDYRLTDMNGLELIAECRRLKPELKTILISGSLKEDAYSGSQVKADGFLGKPYRPEELSKLVRALMET